MPEIQLFPVLSFLAGDRASDLGRVFTRFLFCHTFDKHFGGKALNSFMVKKSRNLIVCPVSNLQLYVSVSDLIGVDLRGGYLFRTTDKHGAVTSNPLLGSDVANCLLTHLKTLGIHCGETMHSLWCGCSITLSHLGVAPEDITRHVGWKSLETAEYYFQTGKVMGLYYYSTFVETGIPSASLVANVLHDKNALRGLSPTFVP